MEWKWEIYEVPNPRTKKNFIEEWFKTFGWVTDTYEVQNENWSETLYSILPELINRNSTIEIGDRAILRSILLRDDNNFPTIKKWNSISILFDWNNSFELNIWNEIYVINTINETLICVTCESVSKNNTETENENKMDSYLSKEEISALMKGITIKTSYSIWIIQGRKVYCIIKWAIQWNLPTTSQPVDINVDIDPNKILFEAEEVLSWKKSIREVELSDLIFRWNFTYKMNWTTKTSTYRDVYSYTNEDSNNRILNDFKNFINALKTWTELNIYNEFTSIEMD